MTTANDLRDRVGFYKRVEEPADELGNTQRDFPSAPIFPPVRAQIRPKLGGEGVLAARLSGTNPVNITVRQSSDTKQITTDWMVKDERTLEVYNIRSIIDPSQATSDRGHWLEMLCEKGVAT